MVEAQQQQQVPLIGKEPNIYNTKYKDPVTGKEVTVDQMGKKVAQEWIVKLVVENQMLRQHIQRLTNELQKERTANRIVKPELILVK